MDKDLTVSQIDRQNILNNDAALAEIQQQTNIKGFLFEEKLCFTKAWLQRILRSIHARLSAMSARIRVNLVKTDMKF